MKSLILELLIVLVIIIIKKNSEFWFNYYLKYIQNIFVPSFIVSNMRLTAIKNEVNLIVVFLIFFNGKVFI